MSTNILPFVVNIDDATLEDLQTRLESTRWADETKGAGWQMGTSVEYLRDLVDYWHSKYDWRAHEQDLNQFNHFMANVDGVNVHFIHERGKGPNPTPIVLTHGWPDTSYGFHKIIPMLTDPERYGGKAEDSFDVIAPDVPGFGFSGGDAIVSSTVADLWTKLMTEMLGYERFGAAGSDVGTLVTKALAWQHPEQVSGIHLTDVGYPTGTEDFSTFTDAEKQFAGFVQDWWMKNGAYAMVHNTKPQSVGIGLDDSPAGFAAWAVNFIAIGADNNDVESAFGGRDDLLTNLTIYWATQTAASSGRNYFLESRLRETTDPSTIKPSTPPAGIARFARSAPFPREWAERTVNVQRFTEVPKGGHFAALEEPEIYASEIRAFFRDLR